MQYNDINNILSRYTFLRWSSDVVYLSAFDIFPPKQDVSPLAAKECPFHQQ